MDYHDTVRVHAYNFNSSQAPQHPFEIFSSVIYLGFLHFDGQLLFQHSNPTFSSLRRPASETEGDTNATSSVMRRVSRVRTAEWPNTAAPSMPFQPGSRRHGDGVAAFRSSRRSHHICLGADRRVLPPYAFRVALDAIGLAVVAHVARQGATRYNSISTMSSGSAACGASASRRTNAARRSR